MFIRGQKEEPFRIVLFHSKVPRLIPQQLNLRLPSALGAPQFIFFFFFQKQSLSGCWVKAMKSNPAGVGYCRRRGEEAVRWLSDGCRGRPLLSPLPLEKSCQSFEAVLVHDHLIVWTSQILEKEMLLFSFSLYRAGDCLSFDNGKDLTPWFSSPQVTIPDVTRLCWQGQERCCWSSLSLDKEWGCSVITPSKWVQKRKISFFFTLQRLQESSLLVSASIKRCPSAESQALARQQTLTRINIWQSRKEKEN